MLTPLPEALGEARGERLGATLRDGGVDFAVFSANAKRIELSVFDAAGARELRRYPLARGEGGLWHGFLSGAGAGLVYGYRAQGDYVPHQSCYFNPNKLLLDPYAREITGRFHARAEHHGYVIGHPDGVRSFDDHDNAPWALKARVAAPAAPLVHAPPRHAARDLVIYELHVKGFSMQLPGLPAELRGTYSALAHPAAIAHFCRLGINAIELLPVHYHLDEPFLGTRGLTNYWGYNTIGFFCPDPRCAQRPGDPTAVNDEFRAMVDALHREGIEVILDVVYNHSAEGSELGPTISMRGLDAASWYRHDGDGRCLNWTGCGNTLAVAHPRVTQFVLDSLRHWVVEMGVDGFRFDLAPALGRPHELFDEGAAFFGALAREPALAGTRLIAEPWDAGPEPYQLGAFPAPWLEWNDQFRDSVRRYWLHRGVGRGEFARRLCASNDLFGRRRPTASVNFVACHDGFTLADFTSYRHKRNHANGQNNEDGRLDEVAGNLGSEGPSDDPTIVQRRARVRRALLASLLLAQGTPMLNAGDEFGNSQGGNNNAWNQDNPTGWLDWTDADQALIDFAARALRLRREHALLRHDHWFGDDPQVPHTRWLTPTGQRMADHDWHDHGDHAFACCLGAPGHDSLLIAFNPDPSPRGFVLPAGRWVLLLDSAEAIAGGAVVEQRIEVPAHGLVLLRRTQENP
jgi:glycogen operon protein